MSSTEDGKEIGMPSSTPVLQAIEELARTSRTRTELRDEYEVY
jgi:hypothetical protein